MTAPRDDRPLEQRVLAFMGAFSQLQDVMDWALERYLTKQMAHLGPLITKHYVRRIRDDERLSCLLAVAKDTGYAPNMPHARYMYERAKQVRDLVGHSGSVVLAWHAGTRDWRVAISHKTGSKGSKVPAKMVPETFDRLRSDCEWLAAHVLRLMYEAELSNFIDFTGASAEPPQPPASVENGEPLP